MVVDVRETMGDLDVKPGGAPVSTAPFLELASDRAMSWAELGPMKV